LTARSRTRGIPGLHAAGTLREHADSLDVHLSHERSPLAFLRERMPWRPTGDQTWERKTEETSHTSGPSRRSLHPAHARRIWRGAQRPLPGHRCARGSRRPAGCRGRAGIAARLRPCNRRGVVDSFNESLVNQGLGINRRGMLARPGTALGPRGVSRHMGACLWDAVPAARVFGLQRTGHTSSCGRCRRWADLALTGPAHSSVTDRSAAGAPESHIWSPEHAQVMSPARRPWWSRRPAAEEH
jgi:hypothetical protein